MSVRGAEFVAGVGLGIAAAVTAGHAATAHQNGLYDHGRVYCATASENDPKCQTEMPISPTDIPTYDDKAANDDRWKYIDTVLALGEGALCIGAVYMSLRQRRALPPR